MELRIIAQRVGEASVAVDGRTVGAIGKGLMILVGISQSDTAEDGLWLASKVVRMRIFPDSDGKMNSSISDIGGEILLVSQFTLFASTQKGNRPSFSGAAGPEIAIPLYEEFAILLSKELGRPVAKGIFGADMQVTLRNEGPVTIIMDSKSRE